MSDAQQSTPGDTAPGAIMFHAASVAAIDRLVVHGRTTGCVTLDEIVSQLGLHEPDLALIAEVAATLARSGVRIADESADAEDFDDNDDGDAVKARKRRRVTRTMVDDDPIGSTSDPVRMYLKEIGRVPLLAGIDEVRLAQRIEAGNVAGATLLDLANSPEVDAGHTQRRRLRRLVSDGEEAKSELTQSNLRLVVSIAKRYAGRGLPLLDLIQEGNLGLMRAVDKFDHTKGFKFSTYATWWIRQAISRAIADQSRTIRIPVHMVDAMHRVQRTQREMAQVLEREPTLAELAVKTGLPEDRVRDVLRLGLDPLSLDSPIGSEEDSNLSDFIEDATAEAPADVAARIMLLDAVSEALSELNEREREIVRMRFGLDDGQARTLEEVGKQFGVTRERIRQIESKTLAKLRHPQKAKRLRDYMDND